MICITVCKLCAAYGYRYPTNTSPVRATSSVPMHQPVIHYPALAGLRVVEVMLTVSCAALAYGYKYVALTGLVW